MRRALILIALLVAGCTAPAPISGLHLIRVGFNDLPGWQSGDPAPALAAFRRGCTALAKKSPEQPMAYAGTAGDWQAVCAAASDPARAFFQSRFTPYAVSGEALFTGYYEPQISGSRTRHDAYQTPVYGLPSDLISVDLGQFLPKLQGEHISGRVEGQKLEPYPDRAEIDAKGLAAAKILFWCDDPVSLFFLQIQGSGRVSFDDGSSARVGFAGVNGRPYTAIGGPLIQRGALSRETVSMATIRDWLKAHPDQAQAVMELDRSFVFFQESPLGDPQLGATGSLGVPLTPLASLAVDARIHPLGIPVYVAAAGPDPVTALMVAEDTGGAIRGAARGDIFFGWGAEGARRAGAMKAPGALYVLLPNSVAARLGADKIVAP